MPTAGCRQPCTAATFSLGDPSLGRRAPSRRSKTQLLLANTKRIASLSLQREFGSLRCRLMVTTGSFMSEPIVYSGIGFLLAILLVLGVKSLSHSWLGRFAVKRLESAAPKLMADIDADMGQLHAQIAVATRRLEVGVEEMRAKTSSQLSEIGRSSESIARLKAEIGDRTIALQAIVAKEKAQAEQLHRTEAELAVKTGALAEVDRKLANEKAELDDLMAFIDARDKLAEAEHCHATAVAGLKAENASLEE